MTALLAVSLVRRHAYACWIGPEPCYWDPCPNHIFCHVLSCSKEVVPIMVDEAQAAAAAAGVNPAPAGADTPPGNLPKQVVMRSLALFT